MLLPLHLEKLTSYSTFGRSAMCIMQFISKIIYKVQTFLIEVSIFI